jgi:hypothetical protein
MSGLPGAFSCDQGWVEPHLGKSLRWRFVQEWRTVPEFSKRMA